MHRRVDGLGDPTPAKGHALVLSTFLSSSRLVMGGATALVVGSAMLIAAPGASAAPVTAPAASTSAARVAADPVSAPVTGSFTDASGGQGTFAGTFVPTEFTADGDEVIATGTLTGTLTD